MISIADIVDKNAWHPGFVAAAGIELKDERNLILVPEKNLSKEPIRIDLFVQGDGKEKVQNEIGHLFRKYNIIEYKSPEDGLSVDDFFKTLGYACLFKGLGDTVDEYPEDDITISIFRDTYPRELFAYLKRSGRIIEEKFDGIYYVTGNVQFPAQIIVTSRLNKKHTSLRILSKNASEDDIRSFIEQARKMTRPGDRNNIDAILQVSVTANRELYEKIRRDSDMCEALRELMKDEIEAEKRESEKKGSFETAILMIKNLMKNTGVSAEQAMEDLGIAVTDRSKYIARL